MRFLPATTVAALALTALAGCGGGGDQSLGDQATVQLKGKEIGVTVTKVEKGSAQELGSYYEKSGISNGAQILSGKTPYYVHYTITDTSGADLSGTRLGLMSGIGDDGRALQSASGTTISTDDDRTFSACPFKSEAPDDFSKKGASFETCTVSLAKSGEKVVGGNYVPDDVSKTVKWSQ